MTSTSLLLFLMAVQAAGPDSGRGWRQDASYRITATLDEPARLFHGRMELRYRNQSPDTLRSLVIQLDLNAYRPGSRWAATDTAHGRARLDQRPSAEFGFTRLYDVAINGVPTLLSWPFAPDSTSAILTLRAPLAPGDSLLLALTWESEPSTIPGVQGQRGRQFDLPAAIPRVAAYGRRGWIDHPRLPGAERSGEFASYLVALDVEADQVMGATGIPLCGDPGWESARFRAVDTVNYQRDWYRSYRDPAAARVAADSSACAPAKPGRKTIIWYAEEVPDFGLATSPDFRYEVGDLFQRPVRALYRAGGENAWGVGLVTGRAESVIAWLASILGRSPWPQTTVVEGLDSPGEGTPMLAIAASPSRAEILQLLGHTWLAEVIGIDGWSDGWLDNGLTNFQSTWYFQTLGERGAYERLERTVLDWDLDGLSEPVAQAPDQFRDPATATAMVNQRGELFFHQLRTVVGGNESMRAILRSWYDQYRLRHAVGDDFLALATSGSGADLSPLSTQWLHGTVLYDYALKGARFDPGDRRTTIEIHRVAAGMFPVDVGVQYQDSARLVRGTGFGVDEHLEITTAVRPRRVTLDPGVRSHDWNMLNNHPPPASRYLDTYFTRRSLRSRKTLGVAPTAWYNDAGGWTFGLRARTDYLDRFDLNEAWLAVSSGLGVDTGKVNPDLRLVVRNPVGLRATGVSQQVGLRWGEG
ncbi:MAG: M1 family aminopeptidase, partial [Gemmatimonadales bacterium]